MEELRKQLADVESFTKPPVVQPILGVRIYAPSDEDDSLHAILKREIIQLAEFEISRANSVLIGCTSTNRRWQSEMMLKIENELAGDREFREFIQYAYAVGRLAELSDATTSSTED